MFLENTAQHFLTFLLIFLPAFEGIFSDLGTIIPLIFTLPLSIILTKKKIARDNIFWAFLLFLVFCFISTLFSTGLSRSLRSSFLYFLYFVSFFTVKDVIKNKKFFSKILLIVILATSASLSLFSFYYLIFHKQPPFGSMNLIYANFGHNHLVDYLIFALPINFCLFLDAKDMRESFGWGILTLFFVLSFIFSFSRAGIAFGILALLLSAVLMKSKQRKIFVWFLLAILSLVLLVFLIAFYLKTEYFSFAENTVFFEKVVRRITLPDRIDYWQQALRAFREKPIFGTGLDTFRFSSVKYQKAPGKWSWFAHNHFLQLFSETGIFGGLAFLSLVILILFRSFKVVKSQSKPLLTGLFIGILVSSLHSLVDYDWQFTPIFLNFWVISGLLLGIDKKKKKFITSKIFYSFFYLFTFLCLIFGLSIGASEILFLKGLQVQEKEGQEKAMKYFNLSSQVFPFHPQRLQGAAKYFYKLKNNLAALWFAEKSLDFEKANWETYKLIGDVKLSEDKKKEALNYYQKATNLNPLEAADLYLKSAAIYKELGDEKKEKEVLLTFFERTKDIRNFGQETVAATNIFMQIAINLANSDSQLTLKMFERVENLNEKQAFSGIEWEQRSKILKTLTDLLPILFPHLTEKQQAKYYFWMSTLAAHRKENWVEISGWLAEAVNFDPENKEYADFFEDIKLLLIAQEAFYGGDSIKAKDQLEKVISKTENKNLQGLPDFKRQYYARAFKLQGEVYQTLIAETWQKAVDFDPWNESHYLRLARYYLDQQKNEDKAKKVLDRCLRTITYPKKCQKMFDELP